VSVRVAVALVAALVVALLAGCGSGSGEQTATVGNGTITVPSDIHGVYGELETILDQLPYEAWYTKCVVAQVKKNLSPAEAETLAGLPEDEREEKATLVISRAGPTCEARHHLPVVDPNSSSKELDLLRAGTVDSMKALAESHGADSEQVACVEEGFEELPDEKVIAVVDGSKKAREGILLSVLKPCASGK
jgi:hypothetical protein